MVNERLDSDAAGTDADEVEPGSAADIEHRTLPADPVVDDAFVRGDGRPTIDTVLPVGGVVGIAGVVDEGVGVRHAAHRGSEPVDGQRRPSPFEDRLMDRAGATQSPRAWRSRLTSGSSSAGSR